MERGSERVHCPPAGYFLTVSQMQIEGAVTSVSLEQSVHRRLQMEGAVARRLRVRDTKLKGSVRSRGRTHYLDLQQTHGDRGHDL